MRRVPVRIKRALFLIPFWAGAQVPVKRVILVRRGVTLTRPFLAHELAHVIQAESHPWPLAYFMQWVASGFSYTRMQFEVAARAAEKHPWYLAWADELIREMSA